ncbi:hypothetical protein Tco_0689502 [Tanacetum coccineum]
MSDDEDDIEGIIDYLEPTSYDGFVHLDEDEYNKRRCRLLGMPYIEPLPIIIEQVKITRYSLGPGEVYTKLEVSNTEELPQTRNNVATIRSNIKEEVFENYKDEMTIQQLRGNYRGRLDSKSCCNLAESVAADSTISNVIIGEIYCQNLVKEQLQSRNMCIQSITNQFVQHPLESPKGKRPKSSYLDVFHGELLVVETSKNEALSKEFDPKENDKNVVECGDGKVSKSKIINVLTGEVSCDKYAGGFYDGESSKLYYTNPKEYPSSSMTQLLQAANHKSMYEYAGFDFDNTENDSLSNMVKTRKEEIHLDRLEIVDDPFVQTPVKQNSEVMQGYD